MKTLSECKYNIAISDGFISWEQMLGLIGEGGSNGSEEHSLEWRALLMFAKQFEGYYK